MKCQTCGFAASDASITVCPLCKSPAGSETAAWPPAPTAPAPLMPSGYPSMAALQKQRQIGILMGIIPLAVDQFTPGFLKLLPAPYGTAAIVLVVLAGIYPHFRGCAHWAESKGYPRYEGRLLGILGWLGVLFLAIRRDKTTVLA